jgi:hypothetical protein
VLDAELLHRVSDIVDICKNRCRVGKAEQNTELLTSQPEGEVPRAAGVTQQYLTSEANDFVAHQVAVGIVVGLEVIDIHDRKGHAAAIPHGAVALRFQGAVEDPILLADPPTSWCYPSIETLHKLMPKTF